MMQITSEKLAQAHAILEQLDLDAWMIFVRESSQAGEPALELVYQGSFTWQSALIITRRGDRLAVVGQLDDGAVRATGDWTEIVPYVQSVCEPLRDVLTRLNPATLALNYSLSDYAADGLTHGMFLLLQQYLANTALANRLVSAEQVVAALRGRKSPQEIERMRKAIEIAESIFAEVAQFARVGITERQVAQFMLEAAHRQAQARPGSILARSSIRAPIRWWGMACQATSRLRQATCCTSISACGTTATVPTCSAAGMCPGQAKWLRPHRCKRLSTRLPTRSKLRPARCGPVSVAGNWTRWLGKRSRELVIHPTIMRWAIRSAGRRMTAVRSSARSGHAMARHHAYRWKPAMSSRSNRALAR